MKRLFAIAAVAVLLAGCTRSSREVQLSLVNDSAETLTNTVVAGTGYSIAIGTLTPGTAHHFPLRSDTGPFKLEFDAHGSHFAEPSRPDPWNGMKEIILTVQTNLSVDCASVTTF